MDIFKKSKTFLTLLFISLFSTVIHAHMRPVISLGVGADVANVYLNQNIVILDPFQNTYAGTHSDTEPLGSIFVGEEIPLLQKLAVQLGLAYYQSGAFIPYGNIYQFGDPAFNNLHFAFQIQNRRVLIETKLLYTIYTILHPYLVAGIGESNNNSFGYIETPITSDAVPMQQTFASKIRHSFTYLVGLGFDVDIHEHLRLGASYRFADLGRAGLGVAPMQDSTTTLNYNHLKTNEFLVQLSYLS